MFACREGKGGELKVPHKFLPLDVFGVSHISLLKNKNAVDRLQISALVPDIFNFEKCVKYANEMTEDVIHST